VSARKRIVARTPTNTPPGSGRRRALDEITRMYRKAKGLSPPPVKWTMTVTRSASKMAWT
jgi:hypothetical protein